jgi:TRAP-type transport system periplasmic protein
MTIFKPMLSEIERQSGGRITFRVFTNGTLAPAAGQYDAVASGLADMGVSYFGYLADRFPLCEAFTFPAAYNMTADSENIIQSLGYRIFANTPSQTKILSFFQQEPYFLYTALKQIRTSDDLKGQKIVGNLSLQQKTLMSVGASPVAIPSAEIYIALEKGVIDGTLLTPGTADAFKLTDVTKYGLRLPFSYSGGMININGNTWSRIPADLKSIIENEAGEARNNFVQRFNTVDAEVNETLRDKGGAVYTPSATERTQWANLIDPVITQWISNLTAKGLPGQDLVDSLRSECQKLGVPFPY